MASARSCGIGTHRVAAADVPHRCQACRLPRDCVESAKARAQRLKHRTLDRLCGGGEGCEACEGVCRCVRVCAGVCHGEGQARSTASAADSILSPAVPAQNVTSTAHGPPPPSAVTR